MYLRYTSSNRPTTTLLVRASKHRSAALPTQRWWCKRWNVCASAVRSCPCGALGTTNTTHTKKFHFVVSWTAEKKNPPKNTASSLQDHKIQTAALQIKRRYELHPLARKQPRSAHRTPSISSPRRIQPCGATAHPPFLFLVGYTALLGVTLERLRLCCSFLPVRGIGDAHKTHNTHNTHNKNNSLRCALGCGKNIPSQKYRLVLTKP